ncbi:N-acetylmuramoyl-L-alanine amidase [Clostridium tertium]|uniref:Sporulation-specific N-acetylmuramoyl-L-alanine amidase n=1 Tax=Clostridium tertium TaxID=1559 RepID=A0A6N3BXW4_9CLOT
MKIVLDYGHCLSGPDTGASANGYREELLTREIGKAVRAKLEKLGHTIIVVSPDYASSVSNSLSRRISAANAARPDISVSIHLNAGGGRGTEIYTKNGVKLSEAVAILIEMSNIGYVNRGVKDGSALALVGSIVAKSMLVETCFIDSSDMSIYNPDKISTAIVKGLVGTSSTIPSTPQVPTNPSNNANKYLNLLSHVARWRVYPTTKAPTVGNEVGFILPSNFGGLSYKIIANPQADVYTINTSSYGTVNIYAPRDKDSTITASPLYGGSSPSNSVNKKYLNLKNIVPSWRVYPLSKAPIIGNEVGSLAPSRYGGLSYEILGNPQTDVYTINTESFGKVNIYAPRDNDSSITSSPIY